MGYKCPHSREYAHRGEGLHIVGSVYTTGLVHVTGSIHTMGHAHMIGSVHNPGEYSHHTQEVFMLLGVFTL